MTRRIGLIGGECTGKSVLASALAQALDAVVVPEVLRSFVQEHGRAPRADEQRDIMDRQARAEAQAAEVGAHWLIGDPAPLMTAVYSVVYFQDESLVDEAVSHASAYDLVIWCDEDIPWVPDDGQRDGPEFRTAEHTVIARLVRERMSQVPTVLVSGSLDERVSTAILALT